MLLLHGAVIAAWAGDQGERQVCYVEVLHSEELPGAPIFQNLVRARLLVTLADRPPFETTVEKFIPGQVPPPRRGQRFKMLCDPAAFSSFSASFHSNDTGRAQSREAIHQTTTAQSIANGTKTTPICAHCRYPPGSLGKMKRLMTSHTQTTKPSATRTRSLGVSYRDEMCSS
jgi:hypothetical protein